MLSGVSAAQVSRQFVSVPEVQPTLGRVTSFLAGQFQQPANFTDILYVNAPVTTGTTSSVTAGIMLDGQGFTSLTENQITFANTTNVVAALGDFNGDRITDFAFAYIPQGTTNIELCVYYGTGATVLQANQGMSSFSPMSSTGGCLVFPSATGAQSPVLAYMAPFPHNPGAAAQLLLEDSTNNILYIIANNGTTGSNGNLNGYAYQLVQLANGAGPIYTGDFDRDGYTDFIINGQTSGSASVFLSSYGSFFAPDHTYQFDAGVRSMLMQDMDGDGIPDMVIETDGGAIEIHHGNGNGTFAATSEGGTATTPGSVYGNGGRLAAINPNTLDILTTTPIGLSLLRNQGGLSYALKTIYNIGPGRTSFALTSFLSTNNLDLAVDSAEGVAIVAGNPDGTFQTSNAYTALAPGLGAVVGKFRGVATNPTGHMDVVVDTGATQAQLLTGNGSGTFATFPGVVDTGPPTTQPFNAPPPGVWSNLLSGDFDGDGNLDVLYSLTGLPQPPPSGTTLALYVQYGNGDGTFNQTGNAFGAAGTAANPDGFYFESAVGDFNGDGIVDVAVSDAFGDLTNLGLRPRNGFSAGFLGPDSNNTDFNQVAAGFFKAGRTSQQDLVFEQGPSFIPYVNAQDMTGKNFTAKPALTGPGAPLYPATVLLTDVDGDGNGDLVVVYDNYAYNPTSAGQAGVGVVYIWYGNGDGTFQAPLILDLSRNYYLGAVADMNGDGLPDLVLSDGSVISILYNQGHHSFGTVNPTNGLYSSEQHFLAGQGINSITLADVNGDGISDIVVANGGATISNSVALGGRTATSLSLAANPPDINTGGITVLLNNIATQPVTGTLVATPEPSVYGATFTMTATLTPSPGVALPTGTVQFYIDGNPVGGAILVTPGTTNSTAADLVPAGNTYAGGAHTLTAVYSGDTVNSPVTLTDTHNITGGATTSSIFMCIGPLPTCPAPPGVPNPSPPYTAALQMYYGQIWNGFVQVASLDGSALTGNLELVDTYTGADPPPPNPLCTLPVGGGACPNSVGTTQGTSVGLNLLTAYYPGDATHLASTSGPVAITVLQDTTASPTLVGAPNPSPAGQPVTFTATLTGNYAAPTGPVTFVEFFPPTATVSLLGTGTLVPGTGLTSTATFVTSTLPVGVDSISAGYSGTEDFAAATFPVITETITPGIGGSFTLTVTPASSSVGVGYAALLTVTATGKNGFAQGINLSCSNLPTEATCLFDTPTLAAGGGTTNLVVSTTAPHTCGTTQPYFLGSVGGPGIAPFALPALAGLLAMFLPGRRRWLRALVAVIVIAGATHITGCSTCTDLGTRPATYTFQVTGTSTVSNEIQSQAVTITVTI